MNKINFLVSGCGGDVAISICKVLRSEKITGKIIGCDIRREHPGEFFYDKCEKIVRADMPGYMKNLARLVEKYKIDAVIPTTENELLKLMDETSLNYIGKARVISANKEALRIGLDKLETNRFIRELGLPAPWTMISGKSDSKEIPCILKSRSGHGSKSLVRIVDKDMLDYYKKKRPYDILQEYIDGDDKEYTCGVFRNRNGITKTIIIKRELVGGLTGYGTVVKDTVIDKTIRKVADGISLLGSINIQLRKAGNKAMIFEINPRFSSTVKFRHMLGFKDLVWSIKDSFGMRINVDNRTNYGAQIFKVGEEYIKFKIGKN